MSSMYFKLFRQSTSWYIQKKVLPYIFLPGPIEIDESRVGQKVY